MYNKEKRIWCRSNGTFVDLTTMNRDYFLKHYWFQNRKIVSIYRYGKTFRLDIKEGVPVENPFNYHLSYIYFCTKRAKQIGCDVADLSVNV